MSHIMQEAAHAAVFQKPKEAGMSPTQRVALIIALTFLLPFFLSSCSRSGGGVDNDEPEDTTPPIAVSDLNIIASTSQTAMLRWTTPEDHRNDNSGGAVDGYDLRVSFDSITAQSFSGATQIVYVPQPLPAGQVQQWVVHDLAPDSVYYFALKAKDDKGNWSGVSNCAWVHCAAIQVVVFADSALERAIRDHIHKPSGDILSSDVDTVTQLFVASAGIISLAGLEHCSSLLAVNFALNEIIDLSPISGLTRLAGLYVSDNNISDLTPLADMASLRQIHLIDNPVTDISPLATIDSLQQLILMGTQVTDFSPLYGMMHLSDVGLDRLNLSDISFMSQLKRPQLCGLAFNNITSVEPLRSLYMLEALNLMQNQISDVGPLTPLVHLRELKLTNNQVTDLQALINNTGLDSGDVVYLEGNPLSQYAKDWQVPTLEARGVTVYH